MRWVRAVTPDEVIFPALETEIRTEEPTVYSTQTLSSGLILIIIYCIIVLVAYYLGEMKGTILCLQTVLQGSI